MDKEFQVGSKVWIRSYKDMCNEYGENLNNPYYYDYNDEMQRYLKDGAIGIITEKSIRGDRYRVKSDVYPKDSISFLRGWFHDEQNLYLIKEDI